MINHNQTWFFDYKYKDRKDDDIPLLWDIAEAVIKKEDDRLAELFSKCLALRGIAGPKLSTGLTWLDPENHIALTGKTIPYYKKKFGIDIPEKLWFLSRNSTGVEREETWNAYVKAVKHIREQTGDPFYEIAHVAYVAIGEEEKEKEKLGPTVEEYISAIKTLLDKGKINDNH